MPSRPILILSLALTASAHLALAAPAVPDTAAQKQELTELRGQIDVLKHDLANNESQRKDATDALRQSESAISDANRVLNDLSEQRELTSAQLARLEIDVATTRSNIRTSQARLAALLKSRYQTHELEAWRLALERQDPTQTSRELTYYRYLAAAQQQLARQLQTQLDQLNTLAAQIREKKMKRCRNLPGKKSPTKGGAAGPARRKKTARGQNAVATNRIATQSDRQTAVGRKKTPEQPDYAT